MNILARYPNESFVINFKNTKEFSLTDIRKIEGVSSNRVLIRVEGGYDQHRIDSYQATNYVNMHKYDNVYTTGEIKSEEEITSKLKKDVTNYVCINTSKETVLKETDIYEWGKIYS